jgi:hypothetical protein
MRVASGGEPFKKFCFEKNIMLTNQPNRINDFGLKTEISGI